MPKCYKCYTSSVQNCEREISVILSPPRLWCFVPAALERLQLHGPHFWAQQPRMASGWPTQQHRWRTLPSLHQVLDAGARSCAFIRKMQRRTVRFSEKASLCWAGPISSSIFSLYPSLLSFKRETHPHCQREIKRLSPWTREKSP